MKKLFLLLAVVAMILPSCGKINDAIDELGNRLDKLEQISIPTIEQQIESINTQLTSLKATDEAIKARIAELENSDKTTATEISNLKAKDEALEEAISDLQEYVDNQIANAKSEADAAYATIEQYNAIVSQLSELKSSTDKLGEDLTAKINNEVKSLTDKITDLENRLKAVEDKVEDLLARIQSVSYIPTYSDGKVTMKYAGNISRATLDFKISPKECVAELSKVWDSAVKVEAVYTQTRAVSFVNMPIVEFEADEENGTISMIISGKNLSEEFFTGTQEASVALVISDGNNSVTSDYIPMMAKEVSISEIMPDNELWYTSSDGNIIKPNKTNVFGANILSNTYEDGQGVITFYAPITSIGERAFLYCSSLTSVTIPDSVTSIGDYAFENCTSLTSITIPNGVTSIGNSAFDDCSSLTSVTIPDSVTKIGDRAFFWCSSLEAFYGKYVSVDNRCLIVNGVLNSFAPAGLTEYTIPDSVTSIGYEAFRQCSRLTSVIIPDSVTSIGNYAFYNCISLTSVTIPDSVTSIGNHAFDGCGSITSVTIPDSVTSIGSYAFSRCTGELTVNCNMPSASDNWAGVFYTSRFTKVTIGNGVTSIGDYAFCDCSNLTSVTIPDSVTSIGNYAFYCSSLTSVTIPNSVTSIGWSAFRGCSSLTSATIGNSVTEIGEQAFYCSSLTSVYCKPTTPPTGANSMFYYNASGRNIYVPTASVDAYKAAQYWSDYADYIVGYDF